MSFHFVLQHRRTTRRTLTLRDQFEDLVTLDAGDVIEIRIGHGGDTPAILELSSQGPTPNGSTASPANPTTLVFDEDDVTEIPPGTYNVDVVLVDASDGQREVPVDSGTVTVTGCVS